MGTQQALTRLYIRAECRRNKTQSRKQSLLVVAKFFDLSVKTYRNWDLFGMARPKTIHCVMEKRSQENQVEGRQCQTLYDKSPCQAHQLQTHIGTDTVDIRGLGLGYKPLVRKQFVG